MSLKLSDASKLEIQLTKELEFEKITNIFGYYGYPSSKVRSIESFKSGLEESARDHVFDEEDYYKELVSSKVLTTNKIDYVLCYIHSYNQVEAYIKVSRLDKINPITNIELLALYSAAYQWMYEQEEIDNGGNPGHLPGMSNRADSNGRYKIWGHDIGNLCYNGISEIKIYNNFILCNFSVDS